MDRTTLLDHLAKTIRDVEEGERQIFRQKEILFELERAGRDGSDARATAFARRAYRDQGCDRGEGPAAYVRFKNPRQVRFTL